MSLSGLIAAKKRIEASIKKYEIPTEETPVKTDSCQSGELLLSLLQSRLNWTNHLFPKYKSDPIQQPKRSNTTRKKWPNMIYLGTCTLELGVHVFEQTQFYQAIRVDKWTSLATNEGITLETTDTTAENLTFNEIVFELNEISNERFIFPKETIIESTEIEQDNFTLCASFVLPLDPSIAEAFFDTPRNKLLKYGRTCSLDQIKNFAESNSIDEMDTTPEAYQPTNIRITKASQTLASALQNTVDQPSHVVEIMKKKIQNRLKKKYIKFDLSKDQSTEIKELIQKSSTVPDITTGPIQAEKKRNEILNAIKLGKRPRDEKFEAELPKNKYMNAKDDGFLKCAYCSTKHTDMWRPGPGGQGTLCNTCGQQWKNGEILIDAPVVSKEEELRLLLERKEREKQSEALETDKTDRETKKQPQQKKHSIDTSDKQTTPQLKPSPTHIPTDTLSESSSNKKNETKVKKTLVKAANGKQKASTSQQQPAATPLSLYSTAGIPLPTLSIDFAGSMQFFHPNCGITLLDHYLSVRLCKDTDQTTINFDKNDLKTAQFEVVSEGNAPLQREILRVKIAPELTKSITAFNETLIIDKTHHVNVRFLEKLDPSGGAVVQRILQRWLVTVPNSSSSQ